VDCDDDHRRKLQLTGFLSDIPVEHVVGVAVQEFEAWLIADGDAVRAALGEGRAVPPQPERLARREAKERLASWMAEREQDDAKLIRTALANLCDMNLVRKRCPAFDEFMRDLGAPPLG
jgi:hypothetical protein